MKKWKSILLVFALSSLIMFFTTYEVDANNCYETYGNYGKDIYYNATIVIISALYYVKSCDEGKITLESGCIDFLPGIFYVKDDTGVKEFCYCGGYLNSIVTIYGFDGLFKGWGLYKVLMGKCKKIEIQTFR